MPSNVQMKRTAPVKNRSIMSLRHLNHAMGRVKILPGIASKIIPRGSSLRRLKLSKMPTLPTIPEMPDLLLTAFKCLSSYVPLMVCEDPPMTVDENALKRRRIEDVLLVDDPFILGVNQLREILTEHGVSYEESHNKAELIEKFTALQDAIKSKRQRLELPISSSDCLCQVCNDSKADCVLLDCGHMVSCSKCAPVLDTCPECGQFVVRAISTSL